MILSYEQNHRLRSALLGYAAPYGERLTTEQGLIRKGMMQKLAASRVEAGRVLGDDLPSAPIDFTLAEIDLLDAAIHRMPSYRHTGMRQRMALLRALVRTNLEAERAVAAREAVAV